jgi:hypothetical protein
MVVLPVIAAVPPMDKFPVVVRFPVVNGFVNDDPAAPVTVIDPVGLVVGVVLTV